MKKKITLTLLVLVCTLCCAFGLAACDFGGGNNDTVNGLTFTLNADGESYSVASNKHGGPVTGDIVIPDKFNDKPVTRIEEHGFSGIQDLTSVVIPNSVTDIDARSFNNCIKLKSINIPDGVKAINDQTFEYCESLTEISIPNSVTSIGNRAFADCNGLITVTIGNGVKSIGTEAFDNCAFESVVVPDSVKTIGVGAFSRCNRLKNIKIGICVESVGDNLSDEIDRTFLGCPIETAELPAFVCDLRYFENRENIKSITINSGNEIPNGAFQASPFLENVIILNGVTKINENAFSDCPNLKTVKLPKSIIYVGENAFRGSIIETAELPADACSSYITVNNTRLKTAKINGGAEIPSNSFNGCTNLTEITIADTLKKVNEYTFQNCNNLTKINYEGDLSDWCVIGGLSNLMTVPRRDLIVGAQKIEGTFVIPETIVNVSSCAFAYCMHIESIVISKNSTGISGDAFKGCNINRIFFIGTKTEWEEMYSANSPVATAACYFYSEEEPERDEDSTDYNWRYWHYDTDGVTPVIWAL